EIIFALGAEDQLVAVDASSNYPEAANDLPNVGYSGALSAEGVLEYEPTHVVASGVAGGLPTELLDQLEADGMNVIRLGEDPSLETPLANIRLMAELTGHEAEGEEVEAALQAELDEAAERGSALENTPRI